jgi:Ca2+-binding EF-hand superfamily protein
MAAASTRTGVDTSKLDSIPGLMTLGVGKDLDHEKAGGFDFALGVDGTYIAFDKEPHATKPGKTPADLTATLATQRQEAADLAAPVSQSNLPEFVTLTGQKLTFVAYFKQEVIESPIENYRVRKVLIKYFLEDDTLEMYEQVPRNSGMMSGKFLKRMQHPAVNLDTLRVGGTITVYGRTFMIVECDDFTRRWYAAKGAPQADNVDAPEDVFTATRRVIDVDIENGNHGRTTNPMKRYADSQLGAAVVDRAREDKFYKYAGQKLVLYGIWDDSAKFGEKHKYAFTYTLADDEVQITEMKDSKAQVLFPMLLKKQRLARKPIVYDDRRASCEDDDGEEDYMNVRDFKVGEYVHVYGRDILLYDCDQRTHDWYYANLGWDQKSGKVDISEPLPVKRELPVPPPTGFGSEEDSLQSWKYLIPKVKKVDLQKLKSATGMTLKFMARMVASNPIDAGRVCRITWYLDDDTLAVYEPPQRNSGVLGGSFARRDKYKNVDTGEYFKASDFYVGATVTINCHKMLIESADDYSIKHMEGASRLWPYSSVEFVLRTLKTKLQDSSKSLRTMFRKYDKDKSQTITLDEFEDMLANYAMGVPKQAAITIFRAFDADGSGLIDYDEFMRAFTDSDHEGGAAAVAGKAHVDVIAMTSAEQQSYAEKAARIAEHQRDDVYIAKLLTRVAVAFRNSKATGELYQKFRQFDDDKSGTIDRAEFRAAFGMGTSTSMFQLTDDDVQKLEQYFFGDTELLEYDDFMTTMARHGDSRSVRSS